MYGISRKGCQRLIFKRYFDITLVNVFIDSIRLMGNIFVLKHHFEDVYDIDRMLLVKICT